MPEKLIVRHCSPTLAGLKIGNLFNYTVEDINKLLNEINEYNNKLNSRGIYFALLRVKDNKALVYVYRKVYLEKMLQNEDVIDFLTGYGYMSSSVDSCIKQLSHRLESEKEFPHEIGVFLGYPLEDIIAFIKNKGNNSKCIGYWKVYGDECSAKKIFAQFKKCTDIYCKKHSEGFNLLRLAVVV